MPKTTVIKRHGGKAYLAQWIISHFPTSFTHYGEPYLGGASVALHPDFNRVGISEAWNDIDWTLMNFWRVLKSRSMFEQFSRRVCMTPFSPESFRDALDTLTLEGYPFTDDNEPPTDQLVNWAVRFFVIARQSRQGLMKSPATPTRRTRGGMNENVSAWLGATDGLVDVHERLRPVELTHMPAVDFIKERDHKHAFFYCDPCYHPDTRTAKDAYAFEMSIDDHRVLLETLAGIKGKFALSGYYTEMYDEWAARHGYVWTSTEIANQASSARTKERKTEMLWFNYV